MILGSASLAQFEKSLVIRLENPFRRARVHVSGNERDSVRRASEQLFETALKVGEGARRPLFQLRTAGSETIRRHNDRTGRIRDRSRERCEGQIYSTLVLLQLVVGEEGIAGIARTLLCGDADGIWLAAHRRRLTAKPALFQVVAEEEYLVRVRTNEFACDKPHTLDLDFRIHILLEGGTDRRLKRRMGSSRSRESTTARW